MLRCGVIEEAAETEPAWKGAGEEVGLQIWRIVVSKRACIYIAYIIYYAYTQTHSGSVFVVIRHIRAPLPEGKGKGKTAVGFAVALSAAYMSLDSRFTISEVAVGWHELVVSGAVLAQKFKILRAIAPSALQHQVYFFRSRKPKKIRTPYTMPTFEMHRICNILNQLKNCQARF